MSDDVIIPVPGGERLRGAAVLTGTAGCVVYVHGFGSDHTGGKAQALRQECARRGWSYAAFDFRGHGESSGTMRELRSSGMQADLDAVREYLVGRGVRRLCLVGSSMGGFASAWYALSHDEVPALVLVAPGFRFPRKRWDELSEQQQKAWRESGVMHFRNQWLEVELGIGLVDEAKDFTPEELARRWRTPALIYHGLMDEVVSWRETLAVVEATPFAGVELRLLGDGDHRLGAYRAEVAEEACRFFARWIGG